MKWLDQHDHLNGDAKTFEAVTAFKKKETYHKETNLLPKHGGSSLVAEGNLCSLAQRWHSASCRPGRVLTNPLSPAPAKETSGGLWVIAQQDTIRLLKHVIICWV